MSQARFDLVQWIEPRPGQNIALIAADAQNYAQRMGVIVRFKFNGVELSVLATSKPDDVVEHYHWLLHEDSK